jgi:hypothetical protein
MAKQEFIQERITYFKALKNRTEQQELFILLAEKPAKTALDEKKLAALVTAEKALIRATKARATVSKFINAEKKAKQDAENTVKEAERKARTHRLVQQGLLIDFAGLENFDKGLLMGAFLTLNRSLNDTLSPEKKADWKRAGDELLATKDYKLDPPAVQPKATSPGSTSSLRTETPLKDL